MGFSNIMSPKNFCKGRAIIWHKKTAKEAVLNIVYKDYNRITQLLPSLCTVILLVGLEEFIP